jgi:hypothetical protein
MGVSRLGLGILLMFACLSANPADKVYPEHGKVIAISNQTRTVYNLYNGKPMLGRLHVARLETANAVYDLRASLSLNAEYDLRVEGNYAFLRGTLSSNGRPPKEYKFRILSAAVK